MIEIFKEAILWTEQVHGKVLQSLGSNGIGYFSIQSFPYNSFKEIGRRNLFLQTRSKKNCLEIR